MAAAAERRCLRASSLTPEAIGALLAKGSSDLAQGGASRRCNVWSVPALGEVSAGPIPCGR